MQPRIPDYHSIHSHPKMLVPSQLLVSLDSEGHSSSSPSHPPCGLCTHPHCKRCWGKCLDKRAGLQRLSPQPLAGGPRSSAPSLITTLLHREWVWASPAPMVNPQTSYSYLCSLPGQLKDFCCFVCEISISRGFFFLAMNQALGTSSIYLFAFMNF